MKLYRVFNVLVTAKDAMDAVIKSGVPPYYVRKAFNAIAEKNDQIIKLEDGPLFSPGFYSGCTYGRFKQLGVHAAINCRAGEFWRNKANDWEYKVEKRNARVEIESHTGKTIRQIRKNGVAF